MNILFYTSYEVSPLKGGTERITSTIASELQKKHFAKCYSIYSTPIASEFERTKFVASQKVSHDSSFEDTLYDFINRYDINIIVNQGAFVLAKRMRTVLDRFTGKHLITVHHFNPGAEENFLNIHGLLWNIKTKHEMTKSLAKLAAYPLAKLYRRHKYRRAYHDAYTCSDKVVLLSKNFYHEFQRYACIDNTDQLCYIHNALSFKEFFDMHDYDKKKGKEVLIVSRLDETQKRISLAIKIWNKIESDPALQDWKLTIVGHGEEYEGKYKRMVKERHLKRIAFMGAQNPVPHYERASIFMLTSAFEGWGLTLTEAQQFGVVPLAFHSYASLTDIITDGENGYVIPELDIKQYTQKLKQLMLDDNQRKAMTEKAIKSSKRFQIDNICEEWINLFQSLKNA